MFRKPRSEALGLETQDEWGQGLRGQRVSDSGWVETKAQRLTQGAGVRGGRDSVRGQEVRDSVRGQEVRDSVRGRRSETQSGAEGQRLSQGTGGQRLSQGTGGQRLRMRGVKSSGDEVSETQEAGGSKAQEAQAQTN